MKAGHLLDMLPAIVRNDSFPISYADNAATVHLSHHQLLQIIITPPEEASEGMSPEFLDSRQILHSKISPPHGLPQPSERHVSCRLI